MKMDIIQIYLWPFTLAELAGNSLTFEQFLSNPIEVRAFPHETQPIWNKLSQFTLPSFSLDSRASTWAVSAAAVMAQ